MNLITTKCRAKCLIDYKKFIKGKEYLVKGFGGTMEGKRFLTFVDLVSGYEFKVIQDTANGLVEDGVLINV